MSGSEGQAKDRVERLRDEVTAAINSEKDSLEAELSRLKDSPLASQLRSVTERSQSSERSEGADRVRPMGRRPAICRRNQCRVRDPDAETKRCRQQHR